MKANTRYTALEILTAAGFEDPTVFGKMKVIIAGVRGIVTPNHVITIQAGTKEIDVVVGIEVKKLTFESDEESRLVSEEAAKALKVVEAPVA